MPSATGVVQEAGVPARPWISTRQSRQEPKASTMSVAHSFGISLPSSTAARMMEVPSDTVTATPSMVSVTVFSDLERGVPKSISWISDIWESSFSSFKALWRSAEIFREMGERAHYWVGREASERTERTEPHGVAEVFEHGGVCRALFASHDFVDQLYPARRPNPAWRALAAGFDGAKLHGEAGLLGHVHGVVEHHDAAMADQPVAGGERLIVEQRVEQVPREIGAERSADLHRAHRATCPRAAANIVDQLAKAHAEGGLEQPAMLDVAGKLDRHGAARAAHAEITVIGSAVAHDDRHAGKRQHVVDDSRLAEQTDMGRQRRLGADLAALAFEALEQRCLLAAHIGPGANPHLHVEFMLGAGNVCAKHAAFAGALDRDLHGLDGMRIFGADIDVAVSGADGDAGNGHALDEDEGIAFHDHAVGEGA